MGNDYGSVEMIKLLRESGLDNADSVALAEILEMYPVHTLMHTLKEVAKTITKISKGKP